MQPDAALIGVTQAFEVAVSAREHGMRCVPHGPWSALTVAAHLHILASAGAVVKLGPDGATVATAHGTMQRVPTMTDHEPIEVLSTLVVQELGERARRMAGIRLTMTEDRAETRRHLATGPRADCAPAWMRELLRGAPKLKLIHACTGGVEDVLIPELVASPIQLACLKGIFDVPGAERAMASIAGVHLSPAGLPGGSSASGGTTGSPRTSCAARRSASSAWEESAWSWRGWRPASAPASSAAHGARSRPCTWRPASPPTGWRSCWRPRTSWSSACPRTPLTEGLFGARQFRAMKRTAYLIDITGRSVIFDLDALVRALREGWIAGADLQIQEGLPPSDSPLWELDNLILSNQFRQLGRDTTAVRGLRRRESAPLSGGLAPPRAGRQGRGLLNADREYLPSLRAEPR